MGSQLGARIRLVATDLDGTFVRPDRTVSRRTLEAVRAARAKGVRVVVNTGRNLPELKSLCQESDIDDVCVMTNGASIINWRTGEYLLERRIPPAHMADILRALLDDAQRTQGATLGVTGGYDSHVWLERCSPMMLQMTKDMQEERKLHLHLDCESWIEHAARDAQRINYNLDATEHGARIKALLAPYGGGVDITTAEAGRMEITPIGVSKGEGLQRLCALYGIEQHEVMAVGDGLNDISMIEYAGTGVAMGNGMDEVKSIANAITDTNDNDGFAQAIERYVLQGE